MLAHLQQRGIAAFTVDVVSNDSYIGSPARLAARTLDQVERQNGGIVLFHDIKASTAHALPTILTELKKRGYKVVHMRSKAVFEPLPALTAELETKRAVAEAKKAGVKKGETIVIDKPKLLPFYAAIQATTLEAAAEPAVTVAGAGSARARACWRHARHGQHAGRRGAGGNGRGRRAVDGAARRTRQEIGTQETQAGCGPSQHEQCCQRSLLEAAYGRRSVRCRRMRGMAKRRTTRKGLDHDAGIPTRMSAMAFDRAGAPLRPVKRRIELPKRAHVLVRVAACGICRTDLHIIDGDLPHPKTHVIPGHEIIGTVAAVGAAVEAVKIGDRVGIPWLGGTCGRCRFCRSGRENLCEQPVFTGYTIDGGYAQYATANAAYAFKIPSMYSDAEAAPLMCAGLIGYRAWKLVRAARRLGIYGFGAAAHIVAQLAVFHGQEVYAFTRPGRRGGATARA